MSTATKALLAALVVNLTAAPRVFAQTAADARAGYDATIQKFRDVLKRGDAHGGAALYTEDATVIESDGTAIRGRAGLEKFLSEFFAATSIKDWNVETTSFTSDGRLATGIGTEKTFVVTKSTGKQDTILEQFLVVCKQQSDKRWLVQYLMETPMPPKAGSPRQ